MARVSVFLGEHGSRHREGHARTTGQDVQPAEQYPERGLWRVRSFPLTVAS